MLDSDLRRWVVCESGSRWAHAVRCFGPSMTPAPLVLDVIALGLEGLASPADAVRGELNQRESAIVLWEVDPESVLEASQWLRQTAIALPRTVQIVADRGLSPRQRMAICEFPVAVSIQHPEQLPRLDPLVKGHFATGPQVVD